MDTFNSNYNLFIYVAFMIMISIKRLKNDVINLYGKYINHKILICTNI